ncbi:hypothetical protein [Caballeronia sp. SL2Y3]|uniref:hypothetical protein n=1 Tax=Caballeronia sp. SL2Y3 TaxID=2878151 RepID=UPI001FD21CAF|nr:hypothetical protein [Caballeronia sp. SL2Y3]
MTVLRERYGWSEQWPARFPGGLAMNRLRASLLLPGFTVTANGQARERRSLP